MSMKTYLAEWMNYFSLNPMDMKEKTGISNKMISKWLVGEVTPSLENTDKMAEVMGISIDDLVHHTPEEIFSQNTEIDIEHITETSNIKTAVRLQNYFIANKISCNLLVMTHKNEDETISERFVISYEGTEPLEPDKIVKIAKKRKYSDRREKETEDKKRYDNMLIAPM